jgi:hypothetical protein
MKEEYIIMRNKGQYDINWFYNYYLEKGGIDYSFRTFNDVFRMGNLQEILDGIDKEYELTSLYDVNNKLIKIWQ